jgi:hypothetical protein
VQWVQYLSPPLRSQLNASSLFVARLFNGGFRQTDGGEYGLGWLVGWCKQRNKRGTLRVGSRLEVDGSFSQIQENHAHSAPQGSGLKVGAGNLVNRQGAVGMSRNALGPSWISR